MQRLQQILIGETDLLQRRLLKIYLVVSVDPMAPSRFPQRFCSHRDAGALEAAEHLRPIFTLFSAVASRENSEASRRLTSFMPCPQNLKSVEGALAFPLGLHLPNLTVS